MSGRVFLQIESQIGGIHGLYFKMGEQSLRVEGSILSGPGVLIVLAVTHPKGDLIVGLNEAGHRGQKFGVCGG